MSATGVVPTDGEGAARQQRAGLVVRPFRGLRYDPAQVSHLAAVTSPPYDVIDPDSASHLEGLDPHNVVRLILPRLHALAGSPDDAAGEVAAPGSDIDLYAQARTTLARWVAEGVLRRDDSPALYVYEQSGPDVFQRGLIAAVELRDPQDRVILPHEDVMPGPVADRLELMRATAANLEPILLVYEGDGVTAALVDKVCATAPLVETTTESGLVQRLWALTDPHDHRLVCEDLAPRQALIADGHHRYATYRRLQAEHHIAGDGDGPWDYGLALLVDGRAHPLRVGAIHRVVAGLGLADAVDLVRPVFRCRPVEADLETALATLAAKGGSNPFLLTDGVDCVLIDQPAPGAVEWALPRSEHSSDWRSLDASVLHALVLDRLWRIDDTGGRISYVHAAPAAVRAAQRTGGVAVLMRPVTVDVVTTLAASGERMPRKSTSFGPKPRTGLVLRLLDE